MATTTNRDGSLHQVSDDLAIGIAVARQAADAEVARLGGLGSRVIGPVLPDGSGKVIAGTMSRMINEFFVTIVSDGREYIAAPKHLRRASVALNGKQIDFAAAVALMDDDLREQAHRIVINDEQAFLDCYCSLHAEKFGEEFQVA